MAMAGDLGIVSRKDGRIRFRRSQFVKSGSRKAPSTGRRVVSKRPKAKSAVPDVKNVTTAVADEPSDEEIRVRAYFRYLERGGSTGDSFNDWEEARRDLEKKKK
jgi:hypothetical protein